MVKCARNGSIDLMKLAFTLLVMLFHTSKIFAGGYIAVDFFFIVSGFLMCVSTQKRMNNQLDLGTDTISFIIQKAKGLFPYYFVAFFLTFIGTQVIRKSSWEASLITLFRSPYNLLMLEMAGNYDMGHRIYGSWYVSAMLIAMTIIYPIRKKNIKLYDYIAAPLLFLGFVGWAYQAGAGVSGFTVKYQPHLFMYNGVIRGLAEISIGCSCYSVCQLLKKIHFRPLGKILISFIECLGYGIVFYCAYKYSNSDKDLVLLLILMISVTLSFSEQSFWASIITGKIPSFLGGFSLSLYLTHEFVKNQFIPYIRDKVGITDFIASSLFNYLFVYITLTIIAAIICYILGTLIKKNGPQFRLFLKRLLIQ